MYLVIHAIRAGERKRSKRERKAGRGETGEGGKERVLVGLQRRRRRRRKTIFGASSGHRGEHARYKGARESVPVLFRAALFPEPGWVSERGNGARLSVIEL